MTTQVAPRLRSRRSAREVAAVQAATPRIFPLAFFVIAVVVVFFLMIYLRIALDRSAFELDAVERQITLQESRQLDLRLELASLQDPLRIATEATNMGMTYPDERVPVIVNGLDPQIAPPLLESPVRALEGARP